MSTETLDRIAELQRNALVPRLQKGASILGQLWKSGSRCASGWRLGCSCPEPREFCSAKIKWLGLLKELHGGHPYGLTGEEQFYMIEAMTLSMVHASGLTVFVEVGGPKPLKLGGHPNNWAILPELAEMDEDNRPAFLEAVTLTQGKL